MAVRTFRGTTDSTWGLLDNWLEGAVPLVTDDVIFDASSPDCNIDTSLRVAKSVNFTDYTNTITFDYGLSVSGNIILGSGMNFSGTSQLAQVATGSITSNGKTCDVPFRTDGAFTTTLIDEFTGTTDVFLGSTTTTHTINGNKLYVGGSLHFSGLTTGIVLGTTEIIMNGTGTITGQAGNGVGSFRNPFKIDTLGTVTFFPSTTYIFQYNGVFTYIQGTVISTGAWWWSNTIACTLNFNGFVWDGIFQLAGALTHTLNSDLTLGTTSELRLGASTTSTTYTGNKIICYGNVVHYTTTGTVLGSTKIVLVANNTFSVFSGQTTGYLSNTIQIDTLGTVTFTSIPTIIPNSGRSKIEWIRGNVEGVITYRPPTITSTY